MASQRRIIFHPAAAPIFTWLELTFSIDAIGDMTCLEPAEPEASNHNFDQHQLQYELKHDSLIWAESKCCQVMEESLRKL